MPLKIRKASKKDLRQLNELNRELHEFLQSLRKKKLSRKQLEQEKYSAQDLRRVLVAEQNCSLIGFASFEPTAKENEWCGKCIELEEIFIKPEFSGKKLGKRLLEKVIQQARKKNANLRLMMSPRNKKALRFYKSQCFETVGYEMVLKL